MPSPRRTSRLYRCTKWACTILAGVMIVAWIGSGWYACWWNHTSSWPYFRLNGHKGAVFGHVGNDPFNRMPGMPPPSNEFWCGLPEPTWSSQEWMWTPQYHTRVSGGYPFILIPFWLPMLAFAVPAAWMWRVDVKRRRAAREGCCTKCGYSLVGTPADKPCPECGTARA